MPMLHRKRRIRMHAQKHLPVTDPDTLTHFYYHNAYNTNSYYHLMYYPQISLKCTKNNVFYSTA